MRTVFVPDEIHEYLEADNLPASGLQLIRKILTETDLVDSELTEWLEVDWRCFPSTDADAALQRLTDQIIDELVSRGLAEITAGEKSSIATHGTPEARARRYSSMQDAINAAYRTHPDWSYTSLSDYVGKTPDFNCSGRTIRRHTTDPTRQ